MGTGVADQPRDSLSPARVHSSRLRGRCRPAVPMARPSQAWPPESSTPWTVRAKRPTYHGRAANTLFLLGRPLRPRFQRFVRDLFPYTDFIFLDMHMTTTNADWKREYGLSQCGSLLDMVDTVSLGDIWADVVMGVPGSRLIIIKMVHFVFVRICNYFVNTIHVK